LAIKSDGTLWAFGANDNGQLGLGDTTDRLLPVQVMTGASKVSAGYAHSLIIKTDNTLWSTGLNRDGRLGLE
jgi:alpha-tubulin suppressor-like RCC1 family protein